MTAVDPYWRQRAACDPTVANELTDVGPVAARAAVRRWCWTCPVRQMCREDAYQQPVLSRARNVAGGWWWDAAGRPKNLIDDPKLWKEAAMSSENTTTVLPLEDPFYSILREASGQPVKPVAVDLPRERSADCKCSCHAGDES